MKTFPDLPPRMRKLRTDSRGYPVPWFVAWVDEQGIEVPHFEAIESGKIEAAIRHQHCWICGELTGKYIAFVIGPMCAVNRVSSEPPSHLDCARFAARNCPFLANPRMARIPEHKQVKDQKPAAGVGLKRNPGVALVWITTRYQLIPVKGGNGAQPGVLFSVGEPASVEWYAEGRPATRAEILHSIETGAPALMEMAEAQEKAEPGCGSVEVFDASMKRALELLPAT